MIAEPHDAESNAIEHAPPFASGSAIRRVHGEGVLLLGGGRALLMQLAHPAVAQGVAEHSAYKSQRYKRLLRTLRPMYAIAFGSADQAGAAAAQINHQHEHVQGLGYSALDPDLLLWVLATLIDTSVTLHARFLRPLSRDEADAYYADMRRVGELLRIPPAHLPANVDAFRAYFVAQLQMLRVTDEARSIASDLLRLTPLDAALIAPLRTLTISTLPDSLRDQYGFVSSRKGEAAVNALAGASRFLLPRIPRALRRPPWFLMPPRSKAGQALD